MIKRSLIYMLLFALSSTLGIAQRVLSEEELLQLVRQAHPFIQQADFEAELGKLGLKRAKGNFDPIVFADTYSKRFNEDLYYQYSDASLIIPTRFAGISFTAGYELNKGIYLNPEKNTPAGGLYHVGIKVPLGQGLWTDLARTRLAQAEAGVALAEATKDQIINDVLLDASIFYWDWVEANAKQMMYEENAALLLIRLQAVKEAFENGERPAVDTLEAFIQWQNFDISAKQALASSRQRFQRLMDFLWVENDDELQAAWEGPDWESVKLNTESLIVSDWQQHPVIRQWEQKIRQTRLEERWKTEQLKPKLDVKYNFLQSDLTNVPIEQAVFVNNYQFGVSFAYPILLRKERFDLKMTRIKAEQQELSRTQAEIRLQNEYLAYEEMLDILRKQYRQLQSNVVNYSRLLEVERRKFELGESSVFLINAREVSLMDARIKTLETLTRIKKMEKLYLWSMGLLE